MVDSVVWDIGYLVSAALFIFGIKRLSSPKTAPQGNRLGAYGMLLAVLVTLVKMYSEGIIGFELILAGLALGTIIGYIMATTVEMTEMPELVALFNGFGGGGICTCGPFRSTQATAGGANPRCRRRAIRHMDRNRTFRNRRMGYTNWKPHGYG